MRSQPYISGSEAPRLFSDVIAERRACSPAERVMADIHALEAEAAGEQDPRKRKDILCRAEEMRCQLYGHEG